MKISAVLVFVLLSSVASSRSKQPNTSDSSVVLSGEDYAFAISVPRGWVCETGQGTWFGTEAILYPQGVPKSPMWGNPDAWITVQIASKRAEGNQTLKNLIAFFAKADSQEAATVSDHSNLLTKDKKTAVIKRKVSSQAYSARALVDDQTIIAVFYLRRFDEQAFNEAFPKFKQIVQSYQSVAVDKKPAK